METPPLHRVEDDLTETAVEDFAKRGIKDLEKYIGKFAAFLDYVDAHPEEVSADSVPDK